MRRGMVWVVILVGLMGGIAFAMRTCMKQTHTEAIVEDQNTGETLTDTVMTDTLKVGP